MRQGCIVRIGLWHTICSVMIDDIGLRGRVRTGLAVEVVVGHWSLDQGMMMRSSGLCFINSGLRHMLFYIWQSGRYLDSSTNNDLRSTAQPRQAAVLYGVYNATADQCQDQASWFFFSWQRNREHSRVSIKADHLL